jgi:flagellin
MLTSSGLAGINSFNALNKATFSLNKSLEKLSTGFRINRASDDAAGLSIATKLTAEIMGRDSVSKNIGDGISSLRTAGGGLDAIEGDLQRMRQLSVQAANGTNSPEQLNSIQSEISALKGNIDDFAGDTEFNGKSLLNGSGGSTSIVTDPGGGSQSVDYTGDFTAGSAVAAGNLNEGVTGDIASIDVTVPGGAAAALADIDQALENVTAQMSEYGAQENALESMADYNSVKQEALMSSRSRIMDTDFASGISEFQNAKVQAKLIASLNSFNSNLILDLLPGK